MASYLQVENLSKSYGPKILFDGIGFNINEGDKIALIAPNGTGKTSLMRILAGEDKSDSGGKIMFLRQIRIAFLTQEYPFDPSKTIFRQAMDHAAPVIEGFTQEEKLDFEQRLREQLSNFRLRDFDSVRMDALSGGEVKRVALAEMLATGADFFIMDEPTNHLDIDAIEYLESYLGRSRCTLLMVTHDRYFLDRVCNTVWEIDHGNLYAYKGNYQNFLAKRDERIANYNAQTDKVRNLLRRELEWIHATPCARTGKAQYRIDAFYDLKERAEAVYRTRQVSLDNVQGSSRLGTKIIDCKDLCVYDDGPIASGGAPQCYLDHFNYKFQRYDKVGIVGRNGVGKSTFINLLTGNIGSWARVEGELERGTSLNIAYYRQQGMEFNPGDTVMDIVDDIRLLEQFLFPRDMWNTRIDKLSGGEKRRLYLLTVLKSQPNLLIMDEPTNDLDIVTLNILEEYLKEFKGSLMIVSHDRHFLDRTVDHLLVFCGDGVVKDFIGNFSEYRAYIKDYEASKASQQKAQAKASAPAPVKEKTPAKRKLSYKEQRELEQIDAQLPALAAEKAELEASIASGSLDFQALQKASERIGEIISLTDELEMRWLELSDI